MQIENNTADINPNMRTDSEEIREDKNTLVNTISQNMVEDIENIFNDQQKEDMNDEEELSFMSDQEKTDNIQKELNTQKNKKIHLQKKHKFLRYTKISED